jgi:ribosomal peptide maturation radical SAM protein 1
MSDTDEVGPSRGAPNPEVGISGGTTAADWPVALVSMPFVSICRPSIQLGLLDAIASARGFPVTTLDLALDFAHQIGAKEYEQLAEHRGHLFGDWIFAAAAFGDEVPARSLRLLDDFGERIDCLLAGLANPRQRLRCLRDEAVPAYLDHLMEAVPWGEFRVVGFTSTFQQNAASIALAERIKRQFPEVVVLFGGANFDGPMGLEFVRVVRAIDYAIQGEADVAFPAFLEALSEGRDPRAIAGVIYRRNGSVPTPQPAERPNINDLPVPRYESFFVRAESLGLLGRGARREVDIPFESARGCWWGAKQHCTFCGLNASSMTFRAKSPERVRAELALLAHRYRSFRFEAVDNIMDLDYLQELLPALIAGETSYNIFYELKANLSREQLRLLSQAGVRRIQPGIESLSTRVLKLMRKGTRAVHNVNLLRWALYYDIDVAWNLIWGFPGETREDYDSQLALLAWLRHLQPPLGGARIWMERFSPIFQDRASFKVAYVRPEASYAYVYPDRVDLEQAAYFFDYSFADALPDATYDETRRGVETWKKAWEEEPRPSLVFWSAPGCLKIEDGRVPEACGTYSFEGPLAEVYRACSDRPRAVGSLGRELDLGWSPTALEFALDSFCERGLMMRDGDQYLSLAIPALRGR